MKVLMSFYPEYASAIMNGAKTWEFRKRIPKGLASGDFIVVYSSAPVCRVLGEFEVGRVLMGNLSPDSSFWGDVKDGAYINFLSLVSYAGMDFVHAIEVRSVSRLSRPLLLGELYPGIKRPPQSFCYIDKPDEYKRMVVVDGILYKPHRTHPYSPGTNYHTEYELCRYCDLQRGGGLRCGRSYCMGFLDGENCGVYLKRYAEIRGGKVIKF